ncbi:MAG: carboxy terminal-processing peptidase [Verrucomicrobiota bacterium]
MAVLTVFRGFHIFRDRLIAGRRRGQRRWGALSGVVAVVAGLGGNGLAFEPVYEAPTEASIACATADVLGGAQISHQPLDSSLSSRFLDGYLEALDSRQLAFFQSDVDEFGWFRPNLAQLAAGEGETWPAHLIFARYLERLAAEVNFETNFLQTPRFDFTGFDSWQPDRRDLPRPRDLEAAQALWQEEVRADFLQEKLAGVPPSEIAPRLARRYERRLQIVQHLGFDEVLETYLDAFAQAFDPHSEYFSHDEAEEFSRELNLSLAGIGGSLEARGGYWVVGEVESGGPAARSGRLHPGDRILAVAQGDGEPEEVTDLPAWKVVSLIRGPHGSTVRLTVIPVGQGNAASETVSLVRDDVSLTDECARASVVDLARDGGAIYRVGVISLPLFYEHSDTLAGGASADVARLIQRLKQEGVMGLVLDLRRNPGGSLEEAVKVAGLFTPAGPVLQTRDSMGRVAVEYSPGTNALYSGPLVVLTSRGSASSSEAVAGALQDYGRAVIVGDSTTFGKGTVQTLVPLNPLLPGPGFGTVKVTMAGLYRPSGSSAQLKGIIPDIVLPSETDLPGRGEAQLENALPWDSVPPAAYRNLDLVRPVLAALRGQSGARVAIDPWFQLVRGELAALAAESGKPLSLNEAIRRRENAAADRLQCALRLAHQAESVRLRESYAITLATIADGARVTEAGPVDDVELSEAENILADYVQLIQAAPLESSSSRITVHPVARAGKIRAADGKNLGGS